MQLNSISTEIGVECMSDVKRTLKVIGIIGALECLFLQEVSEAREGDAHSIFARPDSVLLAGPRQDARPIQIDRQPSSTADIHSAAPAEHDSFPRPIASEPAKVSAPTAPGSVRDSFPRSGEKGEIIGKVIKESGNMMASRGEVTSGKSQPLSETKVYIFQGKIESGLASGELKLPDLTDRRIIDVVQTDADGNYRSKVPAGTYTVFIEKEGKLYSNVFERTGHFSSTKVEAGGRSEENIKDTSEALN